MYHMYIAFLKCEIFWIFDANNIKRHDKKKAGRLLRHANWWRQLYEKNCSVVIYCFFSVIFMLIVSSFRVLSWINFFEGRWFTLTFSSFFILSLVAIICAFLIFGSKKGNILKHPLVKLITPLFKKGNTLNPYKGIERRKVLENKINTPPIGSTPRWFQENKDKSEV